MYGSSLENRLLSMSGVRAAAMYFNSCGSLDLKMNYLSS